MKKLLPLLALAFCLNGKAQIITTVAGGGTIYGNGEQATAALLDYPSGVAVDASGNLYIADTDYSLVRKVNSLGVITAVAGIINTGGFSGDGGPATAALLFTPYGVAVDPTGKVYIADNFNNCIRIVNTNGIINTFAGIGSQTNHGSSGDGGPATAARLYNPTGVAVDAVGNVYIADSYNWKIRKVNTSGIISTIAGNGTTSFGADGCQATATGFNTCYGVAVDAIGNIYIPDYDNQRVRKVNTSGIITTIAGTGTSGFSGDGGPSTAAQLNSPIGVGVDNIGNVYIVDQINQRIRVINTSGIISTIAGDGVQGYSGDGGVGSNAGLYHPYGVAADTEGNIYIADQNSQRVRKVTYCASPITLNIISGIDTICTGASTTLKVNVSGASSYTWSANAGSVVGDSVTISPTNTTTYSVTSINGGCIATKTLMVIVNTTTLNATSNPYSVCIGSSKILSVSGANSYTWSASSTLSNLTIANPIANPTTTTIYTVTGTNACGVIAPLTITLNVNPTPTLTVLGGGPYSQTVCSGGSISAINFSITPSGIEQWGNDNYMIGLSASNYGNIAGYTAPTVTIQQVGIITVNGIVSGTGCMSTNLIYTITINPLPGITTPTITPAVCGLNNGTITGAIGTGGSGNYSYSWTGGPPFGSSSSYTNGAGTYPLTVEDNITGCVYSRNFAISNVGAPTPPVVAISPTLACVGNNIIVSAPPTIDTTYNWTESDGNMGTGNTYTITDIPSLPNPYLISVTSTYMGCVGAANTFSISVSPVPTVSFNIVPDITPHVWDLYPYYSANVTSTTWYWGDGTNTIGLYPSHTYSGAGTYNICVVAADAAGCTATFCLTDSIYRMANNSSYSNMVYINVDSSSTHTTGINMIASRNDELNIYPNPNNGSFVIETNNTTTKTLQVYDVNGKLVLTQTINGKTTVDASSLNEGVYNISLLSNEGVVNKRLVIVR